jgi:hypothetical protein
MSTEKASTAFDSTFTAAIAALRRFRKVETELITHSLDSWVGIEALATSTDMDAETARLAKEFLAARAALRNHQSAKYKEAHSQTAAASSAYIKRILSVDVPARVTLPVHGVPYRNATETIESIACMNENSGVVSGSFNTISHGGASHSTRGFIVEGNKVSFVEDIDF